MQTAMRYLRLFLSLGLFVPLQAQVSNVDFSTQVLPIFVSAGCTSNGCHGTGAGNFTLSSDAGTAYNAIVGVPSGCSGFNYITASDTASSYIYLKITDQHSCSGSRMPASNTTYFDTNTDKLELIRVWIVEGALEQAETIALRPQAGTPYRFGLEPNYPNPFNPATTIYYLLPEPSQLQLTVYDLAGRTVTTLINGPTDAGYRSVVWRGLDASGQPVPAGVYLYRVTARGFATGQRFSQTRKMILLK